jgi:hypothetical protein
MASNAGFENLHTETAGLPQNRWFDLTSPSFDEHRKLIGRYEPSSLD